MTYAFADGAPMAEFSLSGRLSYIGDRYGDQANAYEMGDVTLLDIGARYAFANGMVAARNVRNLTDEAHVSTCTASYGCYYGTGRTVQASLTFKW